MNTTHLSVTMVLLMGLFDAASNAATDELPLGSKRNEIIAAYGTPDQPPIAHIFGTPDSPPPEKVDTIIYRSLKPPRFYWITDDHATGVHYDDLTGYSLDAVKDLLRAHAKREKIEEIDPKALGHDPTGLGITKAWKCPKSNWIALYRAHKDASPSLLIWVEIKNKNAEPGAAANSHPSLRDGRL